MYLEGAEGRQVDERNQEKRSHSALQRTSPTSRGIGEGDVARFISETMRTLGYDDVSELIPMETSSGGFFSPGEGNVL